MHRALITLTLPPVINTITPLIGGTTARREVSKNKARIKRLSSFSIANGEL